MVVLKYKYKVSRIQLGMSESGRLHGGDISSTSGLGKMSFSLSQSLSQEGIVSTCSSTERIVDTVIPKRFFFKRKFLIPLSSLYTCILQSIKSNMPPAITVKI